MVALLIAGFGAAHAAPGVVNGDFTVSDPSSSDFGWVVGGSGITVADGKVTFVTTEPPTAGVDPLIGFIAQEVVVPDDVEGFSFDVVAVDIDGTDTGLAFVDRLVFEAFDASGDAIGTAIPIEPLFDLAVPVNVAGLTALAGQVVTIVFSLQSFADGFASTVAVDNVGFSTAPVPLPAGAMLLGSALMGGWGLRRAKR